MKVAGRDDDVKSHPWLNATAIYLARRGHSPGTALEVACAMVAIHDGIAMHDATGWSGLTDRDKLMVEMAENGATYAEISEATGSPVPALHRRAYLLRERHGIPVWPSEVNRWDKD